MSSGLVNPISTQLGHVIKDLGSFVARVGHRLRTARKMEPVCRHSNIRAYRYVVPATTDAAFIAPNALVMGNVRLEHGVSVMYGAVVRNYDLTNPIVVGEHTSIGDRTTLSGQPHIGSNVYIGAGCSIDSCTIHDNVYIGHGVTIAYGVTIENGAIIAAGTTLPMDTYVGAGELWAGGEGEKVDMVTLPQASEVLHRVHDAHANAESHKESIAALYASNEKLDAEWLSRVMAQAEEQQKNVTIAQAAEIPVEARRFMEPRVYTRRPEFNLRTSVQTNRFAPWQYRGPMHHTGNV